MLRRQSETLSLTKSGHPTPSHPSDHHLKLIFFSSPTDCVCVCVTERDRQTDREREREGRERGRTSGLSQSVRFFFSTYFISCNGPCALKEKWHRKDHIIIIIVPLLVGCFSPRVADKKLCEQKLLDVSSCNSNNGRFNLAMANWF